ncbi:Alpha/Beta hydrolase protein [Protomyces lactucae-debilis]|uniref:Alpha/Beta hydrolase protein n=1 Tax=Protomyces lactucae-debilis TaxID=2754530 RepID=A0A1Y2F1N4_PROLT|nr:Alpha/Beta hydrolase protein [Protomyces lactucae-debilis]ORY77743.1 Alpha/Beta hydrolase protein [Protomyces lactucae-debilis]
MLDHLLGRPSTSWRKTQVLGTSLFWLIYANRSNPNGPPMIRALSARLQRALTPWQLLLIILNLSYVVRHLDAIVGLAAPEPLAHMYSASFFRATWLLTALDAGFWTAMPLRPAWLRHLFSLLFSLYYLLFAQKADEKVRKIKATITTEQLRVSWEKNSTPILGTVLKLLRPRIKIVRKLEIPRAHGAPVKAWLYFDGTEEALCLQEKVVISFPGGGFVSMSPREHDDAHMSWAKKLQVPLISIDYSKAPEKRYPYAIHECLDAYKAIMCTKGAGLGIGMSRVRKCALVGDSAGGNYVSAVTILILEHNAHAAHRDKIPVPDGLVLIYPFLDFNITSWMTADHLRLLRQESHGELGAMASKRQHERRKSVLQVFPDERVQDAGKSSNGAKLVMTSRVSFFQDRIISADMMRAMALLYVGPDNKPDFETDYLLSPIRAPTDILAKFPKTFFLCGEVDPFADDTIIMAGRIREAKRAAAQRRRDISMSSATANVDERQYVEMTLVRGISHGFLQMRAILPEARNSIARCRSWMEEILEDDVALQLSKRIRRSRSTDQKIMFTTGADPDEEGGSASEPASPAFAALQMDAGQVGSRPSSSSSMSMPVMTPAQPRRTEKRGGGGVLAGEAGKGAHRPWETKHLLDQDELLANRRDQITRGIAGSMRS